MLKLHKYKAVWIESEGQIYPSGQNGKDRPLRDMLMSMVCHYILPSPDLMTTWALNVNLQKEIFQITEKG